MPIQSGYPALAADVNNALAARLPLAGGNMTGPILLYNDPTLAMHPVSLQYYNAHLPSGGLADAPSDGNTYGRHAAAWSPVLPTVGANLAVDCQNGGFTVNNGQLTVATSSGWNGLLLQYPTGQGAIVQYATATGRQRWDHGTDGAAESTNNAGSNYVIDRYADSGSYIDSPFSINRASGVVNLTQQPTVQGTPLGANNIGRNLLDNASANVNQRGNGPFTASWVYTLDRWQASGNTAVGATMTTTGIATPAADAAIIGNEMVWGEIQCVFTGGTAAGSTCMLCQCIEDPGRMSNRTVIVSFYARCATGTLRLGVNLSQSFGPGGSGATPPVNLNGQSVTINTTLARYSMTFTLPSVTSPSIVWKPDNGTWVQFWFSADTTQNAQSGSVGVQSGTVAMTGFQCEFAQPGQTQPTPLEVLGYADDTARCQRYYQTTSVQLNGYSVTPNGLGVTTPLPVMMRASPTVTLISTGSLTNTTNPPTAGNNFGPSGTSAVWSWSLVLATGAANYAYTLACSADL